MESAQEQLWQAYGRWKSLSHEESAAIHNLQWEQVHRAQNSKRDLKGEIVRLTEKVQKQFRAESEQKSFDARLREIVNELISLETQNNLKVQARMDAAAAEKRRLDSAGQRLRQVHSRYVPAPEPFWENRS